nr:MAG TPA: TIR domain [Bacteriophage sp.]
MNVDRFNLYANFIFSNFKDLKAGQGTIFRNIRHRTDDKFSGDERLECFFVLNVLLYNNFLQFTDDSQQFIVLTQNGADYLYAKEPLSFNIGLDKFLCTLAGDKIDKDKVFNELWIYIGLPEALYNIPGPLFYNAIRPYLTPNIPPTYTEYIEKLKSSNASTSRIKWYRALFTQLKEEDIYRFLNDLSAKVNDLLDNKEDNKDKIDEILNLESKAVLSDIKEKVEEKVEESPNSEKTPPHVFISYSWDNDEHQKWVMGFAEKLRSNGIDARVDRYLTPGKDLVKFMQDEIRESDIVLVIITPKYKEKSESGIGGASYEKGIISHEIYNNQDTAKFIPVLKEGKFATACPDFMSGRKGFDFSTTEKYDAGFADLLKALKQGIDIKMPPIKC